MQIAFTRRSLLRGLIAWTLVAFFLLGGIMNLLAPAPVQVDYERWGYPDWFHYLAGLLELTAAVLLSRQATRRAGAIVAAMVMAGALATLLLFGELGHALAPAAVLTGLALCLHLDGEALKARWEGRLF